MTDPSVRKQKSGDQLAVGDWLAPDALTDQAAEVLFAHAYPAREDRSRDSDGVHVQLVVRELSRAATYCDLVAGTTLFDLATDEDLAVYRDVAERERLAAELRDLADLIVRRELPVPQFGMSITASFPTAEGVRQVAEALGLEVESRKPSTGVQAEWPKDRASYEQGLHVNWLTIHDEPEPEPAPKPLTPAERIAAVAEVALEYVRQVDPLGLGHSREADDPTPVSPARVPAHTGEAESHITDDGHREDNETPAPVAERELGGPVCNGAPSGFEADCGTPGPHGPHPIGEVHFARSSGEAVCPSPGDTDRRSQVWSDVTCRACIDWARP